jgi:hypothetical protein
MSDYTMRFIWDPETIGIREMQDRALTAKDASVLQDFHDSYSTEDDRGVDFVPRRKIASYETIPLQMRSEFVHLKTDHTNMQT